MTLPTALAMGAVTADTATTTKGFPAITKMVVKALLSMHAQ